MPDMERITGKGKSGVYQPIYTSTTAAFEKLSRYEDTGLEPEEVMLLKERAFQTGEWVVFIDDAGNTRHKCSVCDVAVARNSQKSRYCPSCGARLLGD